MNPAHDAPFRSGQDPPGLAAAVADVIEVRDLRKTYKDGTKAVQGVSFHVKKGEIFGLLGPNGAGKTTTMHVLGTLHRPTSGRIRVLGLDPVHDANRLRQRIGFAMQEVGMDDLATAEEMLRFHARLYGIPRREAADRATELLRVFDLEKHAKRRVTRFSGGMQRRLDLAVSLLHEPEVLFLDEPSTGLDPTSRADLWAILRRLRRDQGITIVMSTHYMDEADALCDRIAVVNQGRIAATGTPDALKRQVGADRIRIQLDDEPSPSQRNGLERVFGRHNLRVDAGTVHISVEDGGRDLMPALRHVADVGLRVKATRVMSPTLDDVFLHYTGTRLEEDA